MIKQILVPVDGSEPSRKALDFACELATKFSANVSLVHVVEWIPGHRTMVLGTAHATIPVKPEEVEEAGRSVLEAAGEHAESLGVIPVHAESRYGSPAREILEFAENQAVDTIVMGSRGLSDIAGLLLGSVSHKVSHLAKCSCIVVR